MVKLRLYHHSDGARIAYREAGTGPPIAFLHSGGLSHREWSPVVEELADRYRLVLPDLPLHGDSEDRPRHSYSPDWLAEVVAGFIHDACGPRPIVAGHDLGAMIALRGVLSGALRPAGLVLMPCALHRRSPRERAMLRAARAGGIPGVNRVLARGLPLAVDPMRLTATGNTAARDLLRHATDDLPGNVNRARSWSRLARQWQAMELLDAYAQIACRTLLLWADGDPFHPVETAEEALDLLPDAQLRVLDRTGFLLAYDDAVGVAREIAAWSVGSRP